MLASVQGLNKLIDRIENKMSSLTEIEALTVENANEVLFQTECTYGACTRSKINGSSSTFTSEIVAGCSLVELV